MINFIILTNTISEKIYSMTQNAINSIVNSKDADFPFDEKRIFIIESNKQTIFNYTNSKTILYDREKFNYNHAINIGLDFINADINDDNNWFCFMNNDIICDDDWLIEISKAYQKDKSIMSFSPQCIKKCQNDVELGYVLGKHLQGYCFISNSQVIKAIEKFDETFDFYFQDDDYLEQIRMRQIKHACVKKSIVIHLGQQTTGKEDMNKLFQDRDRFIRKYSMQTYIAREYEKYNA